MLDDIRFWIVQNPRATLAIAGLGILAIGITLFLWTHAEVIEVEDRWWTSQTVVKYTRQGKNKQGTPTSSTYTRCRLHKEGKDLPVTYPDPWCYRLGDKVEYSVQYWARVREGDTDKAYRASFFSWDWTTLEPGRIVEIKINPFRVILSAKPFKPQG